jgi:alpha-galactosidase
LILQVKNSQQFKKPLMPIHLSPTYWILETDHTAYALGLDADGRLVNFYWGERLLNLSDYPTLRSSSNWASFSAAGQLAREEYPAETGLKYIEPCFKACYADGVRDTALHFEKAEQQGTELCIQLHDALEHLHIVLHYRLHEGYDLIERWAEIINAGDAAITLMRVFTAQWHLPPRRGYRLSHLYGRWADEWNICREPLTIGTKVLESRRITTSHHAHPWFAVDGGSADEDQGEVWFSALAWSGNWKFIAESTEFGATRLSLGLNDWDFAWRLNPGESFSTPPAICGYTPHGFGEVSRLLHDYTREQVLPHGKALRKVLYNSWEATTFDVDEASQVELAKLAAEMGMELFVMDDGWFHGRKDDHAGLGDWWPDEQKFPCGLTPLIEQVNALGMDFGLWVEPEMVNPDSELYRAHPDWVIHFPGRRRSEARNQLILNFARPDVQDTILEKLDRILSENNIRFIKWDMNRNASEPGWDAAPGDPRELWVRYVQGVYRVWGILRQRHPQVTWQTCSGGGGRVDLGILRLADQAWVSDNTEPTARLNIQEGYSQVFPACTMEAWVTDMGADYLPLEFRIGGHLVHWGAERRAEAAKWIARYKEIRPIIQFGDLYRLRSAQQNSFSALMYVSKDRKQAVLFAFRTHQPLIPQPEPQPPIYPRGLDPKALYKVEGIEEARSGLAWMRTGIELFLEDYQSTILQFRQVD